ncbi:SGNH/GDSL hydrolase family protein [Candidatus Saccharibacteria bacterium]|nr:SGNH/GDSL hydrolase family protein [Candidatus Saccharibacteria bacterium]
MKTRFVSIITGTIIVFTFLLPNATHATSKYDALTDKLTTPTMINYTSMYGKTCGSTTDDYANKWLWAFRRQQSNDRENHPAAVKSLETAISSADGAYAVVYERVDNDTGKSYRIHIYWTEHDKESFETIFSDMWRTDGSIAIQSKPGHYKRLHYALVSSPLIQKSVLCTPAFIWGYPDFDEQSVWIHADSAKKIYVSTFDTTYPDGYTGRQIPSKDPALTWKPTSSQYDDLIEKITTNKLINYIDNFRGKTCGSPWVDYSNSWLNLVRRQQFNQRKYHSVYMKSLYTAIARGAYAIGYNQINRHNDTSYTGFITIYWTENKSDYKFVFSGEYPTRNLYLKTRRGAKSKLYAAVVASPGITQMIGNCDIEFLWGNNSNEGHISSLFSESYNNWIKLFRSTFDVEYPDGYRGMKVPGNPTKLDYLALGDSYSSGEGDTERNNATGQKYYSQLTDVNEDKKQGIPGEKCHISTHSYPYKLAQYMELKQTGTRQWDTVACSGATIYDLNGSNSGGYDGQNDRLRDYADKNTLQKMALNEMIPGRVKQIEFVKKYQPKVITLTAGGNDVGFGKKIKDCVNPFASSETCDWANSEMGTLGSQIRGQFDRLVSLYKELKSASPGVKIYAIGYPQFITDKEPANCGLNAGNANVMERRMIVRATQYMNEVIEAAARKAGVKYVDISQALNGGKMCEKHQIYMTGIVGLGEQESYHPNKFGHTMIFVEIAKQLNHESLLTYSKYPSVGDESVNAPSSIYFDKGVPSSVNTTMLANSKPSKGSKQKVVLAKNSLQPGSSVRVEIRSKPVDLGSYTVLNDGSMKETITIPDNIPAGYHTLFIYGKSASGEDIKITQTLLVTGKDKEDLDDNGIKDANQPCGAFLKASGKDEDLDGIDDACDPEITDPILYAARNGKSEFNEDEGKIYVFRNTRAEKLTGVNNDYIDKSSNKDNTEALIASGLTEDTKNLFFSRLVIAKEDDKENNISKGMPIVLVKDINEKCYALKPEDYLSPVLRPGSNGYKPRRLIKLNRLPKGVSCEE